MIFESGQRLVFIGDSVTDCGRRDRRAPYGDGYVSMLRDRLTAKYPETELTWHNVGVSGNTVRDLKQRWDRDAIGTRPDWLAVMIGINDIWRLFMGLPHDAVPLEEYRTTLRELLLRARQETGCRLILASPYLIEPDRDEPQRRMTDEYVDAVAQLAAELGSLYVDTQTGFDRVLRHTPASTWADDRIHPNGPSHAVLAQAFLDVID